MPPPEKPRHLYRHILRQTQILHDDIARGHIARIVRARFETRTTGSYQLRQRLKRGRNFLSTLERANAGVYKPLEKILKLGYGRLGPRWHELMKPVLAHPPTKKPEPLVPDNRRTIPPVMTEPLAMLLKWSGVGKLQPEIPETNIWLQEFSKVREANIRWRHHTHIVAQAKPPIPEEEYQRLEAYATGAMTPEPPRRGAEMVLKMRRKCIEMVNRRAVRPLALKEDDELGHAEEELTRPVIRERPRDLTSRSWKRHWKALLEEIPVLVYDEKRKKWVAQKSDVSNMPVVPVSKEEVGGYEHMEDPRQKNRRKVQQKEVRMTRLLAEEERLEERNRDTAPPTTSRPENNAAQSSPQLTETSAPVTSLLNALAALDPSSAISKNIPSFSSLTPKEPEKAPVIDHFKVLMAKRRTSAPPHPPPPLPVSPPPPPPDPTPVIEDVTPPPPPPASSSIAPKSPAIPPHTPPSDRSAPSIFSIYDPLTVPEPPKPQPSPIKHSPSPSSAIPAVPIRRVSGNGLPKFPRDYNNDHHHFRPAKYDHQLEHAEAKPEAEMGQPKMRRIQYMPDKEMKLSPSYKFQRMEAKREGRERGERQQGQRQERKGRNESRERGRDRGRDQDQRGSSGDMVRKGRDQRGSADMGRHRDHRDIRDPPNSESREGVTYNPSNFSHSHSRTSPHHALPSTHRGRGIIHPREHYLRQKEEEEKRKREEKEARLEAEREVERRREEKVRIMKMALGKVDFL